MKDLMKAVKMSSEQYKDKDILEQLYWGEGLSLPSVAERLGCSHPTVYRYFVKHDIPRRSVSEAEKLTFQQGRKSFNKGKHLSSEHRRKISEALTGQRLSKETKRKISQAKRGQKLSEETRRKISTAQKKLHPKTGVYKKCKRCGKRFYVEPYRKDIAQFCSRRCNILHNKLGELSSPPLTAELIERLRKNRIKGLVKQSRGRSSLEKMLKQELEERNVNYEEQRNLYDMTVADFVFLQARLVVYADGDYWHANPDAYEYNKLNEAQQQNIERDRRQNKVLKQNGWTVLRFWGHEIREDVGACVDKIQQVIEVNK